MLLFLLRYDFVGIDQYRSALYGRYQLVMKELVDFLEIVSQELSFFCGNGPGTVQNFRPFMRDFCSISLTSNHCPCEIRPGEYLNFEATAVF